MRMLRFTLILLALAAMTFYFSACLTSGSGGTSYGASPYGTGSSGGMMGQGMMGGGGMMGQGGMGGGMMGGSGGMMGGGMMGGSSGMMGGQDIPQWFLSNGERIYYTGISASGRPIAKYGGPMWLNMRGGGCVSCHGEDGRGGVPVLMGSAIPPDISYYALTGEDHAQDNGHSHQPYSEAQIKRAIVQGINAGGKTLNPTMPRWQMSDGDLKDLIEYLKAFPRPELIVSQSGPQSYGGHARDSAATRPADDDHPHPAEAGTNHNTAASTLNGGDPSHSAPAGASAGRPSYTFLVSLLAVVAVTFGAVFYVKRRRAPAISASQSHPGLKEMKH